jgi:cell division protein FtsB
MRIVVLIFTAIFAGAVVPAQAQAVIDVEGQKAAAPQLQGQGQAQPLSSGRYSFSRVDDGFLRLDNASGEVAYCSARPVGWACEAVAIDRSVLDTKTASVQTQVALLAKLDSEIARLHDEIESLKREVAALKEPPPPRPPADLSAPLEKGSTSSANLPTQQDMARAREYLEETWRRLVEMIVAIQKDIMRKG